MAPIRVQLPVGVLFTRTVVVVVADDEARAVVFDGPGRRKAAPDVITSQPIFANPVDEQSKIKK